VEDGSGARLRELRKHRMYSQRELAERANVSLPTVQRIEQGMVQGQPKTLRHLAEALGVEPHDLLTTGPGESDSKGLAPLPPRSFGQERGYPYPWMSDTLARLIDGWSKQIEVPPQNPMVSYAVRFGAVDALGEILRFDIPGDTLQDRVPRGEVEERVLLARKVHRIFLRADEQCAQSQPNDTAGTQPGEESHEEVLQRWAKEFEEIEEIA
jgi:transcriptional regulator with XRE-family HTH domain